MSTVIITDEAGTVGGVGTDGTQQVSAGRLTWNTCLPSVLWERTAAWSTSTLDGTIAAGYNNEDWIFSGTISLYWLLGGVEVRREVRTFSWLNGVVVSDATQVNGSPALLASSAVESIELARSSYTFTPVWAFPLTPPSATFQRPDSLLITLLESWFDQSTLAYDTLNMVASLSLSSVFEGSYDFFGSPRTLSTGHVGLLSWNIYRSHDGDPYGLVWEDCSGGGGGGGGGDDGSCTYREDVATTCAYAEAPLSACVYADTPDTTCTYTEG